MAVMVVSMPMILARVMTVIVMIVVVMIAIADL